MASRTEGRPRPTGCNLTSRLPSSSSQPPPSLPPPHLLLLLVTTLLNLVSSRPQPDSLGVLGSLDPQILPEVCWGEGPLPAS